MGSTTTTIEAYVKVTYAIDNDFDKHEYFKVEGKDEQSILEEAASKAKEDAQGKGIEYDHLRVDIIDKVFKIQ